MGADFIFAITKQCEDPDATKEQINQLPLSVLADIAVNAFGEEPDPKDSEGWENVRNLLHEGIFYASKDYQGRQIGTIRIDEPGTYVITGGMSWGDDPTEACQALWALNLSGLVYD